VMLGWCEERAVDAVQGRGHVQVRHGVRDGPRPRGIWSVTCFVVRTGFRRQGRMYEPAAATVDLRQPGRRSNPEGYPTEPPPGKTVIWDAASVELTPGIPQRRLSNYGSGLLAGPLCGSLPATRSAGPTRPWLTVLVHARVVVPLALIAAARSLNAPDARRPPCQP
jgi:hypothetical protein